MPGLGAYQAFVGGNFISGVVAKSGLFGGGRDVAQELHAEIMKAIGVSTRSLEWSKRY